VVVGNTGAIKIGAGFGGTETWTSATSAYPTESMYGVAYSPSLGRFCAVGSNHRIQCNSDDTGMTWVGSTLPLGGGTPFAGVIWSEKHQLFIAWTSYEIFTSPDGMTWKLGTQPTYPGAFNIGSVVALDEHLALFSSLDHNYVLMVRVDELYIPAYLETNSVLMSPINATTQDDDYFVDVLHVQTGPSFFSSAGPRYLFNGRLLGVTKNGKIRATHYFG